MTESPTPSPLNSTAPTGRSFARFTDAGQMRQILQEQLPLCQQGQVRIADCQVLHAQYYANLRYPLRSRLGVCYALTLVDPTQRGPIQQILYARARLGGQSEREFVQAQSAILWPPRLGQPVVHLPTLDMTVWSFPNDPQLPHLAQVIDPAQVRAHLPYAALPTGFNRPEDLAHVEVEVVHYYPEERCTNRYQLWSQQVAQPLTLFGKTFADCTGSTIAARMAAIGQRSQVEPELFGVTQPLAYDETIKTIWLKFQPGRPLVEVVDDSNDATLLEQIARGLVALQQGHFPNLRHFTPANRLEEISDKAEKLAHATPRWQPLLEALLAQLTREAAGFANVPTTLLHGDFHLRQFLVEEGRVICCDFDEFAQGDPLQDVASFLVDLQLGVLAADRAQAMAQCFYQAYCRAAPWDADPARLRWQMRYQFFTKAYRAYRQQRPGWEQRAEALLGMAQCVTVF